MAIPLELIQSNTALSRSPLSLEEIMRRQQELTTQREQPRDIGSSAIYQSILAALPTLIGIGVGGKAGGALGAKVGAETQSEFAKQSEAMQAEEAAKKEKALSRDIETYKLGQAERKQIAEEAKADKQQASENRKLAIEQQKLGLDTKKLAQEYVLKSAELAQKQGGTKLTDSAAETIAGHKAAFAQVDDLETALSNNLNAFGPIAGRIQSLNPYSVQAKSLQALFDQAAQNIGKSLEGGKLTDADIARYKSMLPQTTDTPDIALAKITQIRRYVAQRETTYLDTLTKSGYNTGQFITRAPEITKIIQPRKPLGAAVAMAGPPQGNVPMPSFESMTDEELRGYLGR